MSNDKNIPPPPPDDFSKTTPNIRVPDNSGPSDWDKTNYNVPRPAASPDDWGKTVTNIRPIDTDRQDYSKTALTGSQNVPNADWGVTQANLDVRQSDFAEAPGEFGGSNEQYDKTTPYFKLPEAERNKYQNLPPTRGEQAEQEKKEREEKGGVPSWVWASAGLMSMFFFAVAVLLVVYFFVLRDTSFEVTVVNAPPGSDIQVDGSSWSVTDEDGSRKLPNLKSGRRQITVVHPTYTCLPREVTGGNGVTPEPIRVQCKEIQVEPGEDCSNIGPGEENKAERCFNTALANLKDPFSVEDLIKALNLLIVNFKSGSYEIPTDRLAALQKAAGYINRVAPTVVLEVGGHTDNVGNDPSNQILSDNRAKAVKDKLVQFGVRSEVLQTRGYGAGRPKTDNSTEIGKFQNRRIEYSIVRK